MLKQKILLFSVFITGACVLVVEVVAVRVLSPYYGNTIFSVSSVISTILAALSSGYYVGGKYADKHSSARWFFNIVLISGLCVLFAHFIGLLLLPLLSTYFSIISGPLVSALLLFFVPAFLLGMLSPYAIKLQTIYASECGVGTIAGTLFFWSTLGSICGSLLTGFVLIPHFGVNVILIATGSILFSLGLVSLLILGFEKKKIILYILIIIILISGIVSMIGFTGGALYNKDGVYERIIIYDSTENERPTRFLQLDKNRSGAMFLDTDDPRDLVYEYSKYYVLYKIFAPHAQNILVLGGGAYSIPKAFLADAPQAHVDVSEIEPALFSLAHRYFNVKNDVRLHNYTEDGRHLLQNTKKKYDVIFGDAYHSFFSIPTHLTTREFFVLVKEKLSDHGVFIANIIGDLVQQGPSFVFAEIKTLRSIFPQSYFFAVKDPHTTSIQNIIMVAYNGDEKFNPNAPDIIHNSNHIISSLQEKMINVDAYDLSDQPILTDDYAPVDYMLSKTIQRHISKK